MVEYRPHIEDKMTKKRKRKYQDKPTAEQIESELASVESMDDFFGRDGVFARLFASTMEEMMEAELSDHLGYEKHEAKGRNSGNSRNGRYSKKVRTSAGDTSVHVPRDRNGTYEPALLEKYSSNTNELEEKILGLYAKGVSTRDIEETMRDLYGIAVSASTVSKITGKVQEAVIAWQNRPLAAIYPIIYLDAIHIKIRRDGRVQNTAVYIVLAIGLDGHRDILGHWVGDGGEGANFWLSVITDLQTRGVEDVFIACVDGLNGFSEAIEAVFPQTIVQRCIIHQIRTSLRYVSSGDQKAFMADLKKVYKAATREAAEQALGALSDKWSDQYVMAVRSWETHWDELSAYFDFPAQMRRIIYTTNTVEGYNRQLRKVTKTKGAFPSPDAVTKLLYLAQRNIVHKWKRPIVDWPKILNQLAIRFEDRFPL